MCITEATSSNIFIIKNNTLLTPKKDVLEGVVRSVILKITKEFIEVKFSSLKVSDIQKADEVFLTNSIDGIMSVSYVNGKKIGNGKEGGITHTIRNKFDDFRLKISE